MTVAFIEKVENQLYESECGWKMARENGDTPNGNPLNGYWVLRNPAGEFIDYDRYRSDLMSRNAVKYYFNH
jgi:hypothetical protein